MFILEYYFASKPSVAVREALSSAFRDKEVLNKTRVIIREYFINFSRRESFRRHKNTDVIYRLVYALIGTAAF
jgi:hypothetical protein